MSSVVRLFLVLLLVLGGPVQARDLHILVIGERSAANCNEHRFGAVPNVYQMAEDGRIKPANDPLDWADCSGGSIWVPLGQRLVKAGLAERVVFLSVGLSQAGIVDWLPGGRASSKLAAAIDISKRTSIRFDYVLFQPGSSDAQYGTSHYIDELKSLIRYVAKHATVGAWVFAKGLSCPGIRQAEIEKAQESIGRTPLYNRFEGPDTTVLETKYGFGECGLNRAGQHHMAAIWAKALLDVEKLKRKVEKETLLYYFR
jgi:hypothetical protein